MSTTFNRIHQILALLNKHQIPMTLRTIMEKLHIPEDKRRTMQLTIQEMLDKNLLVQVETKHKRRPEYNIGSKAGMYPDMIEGVEKLSWYIAKAWLENLTTTEHHVDSGAEQGRSDTESKLEGYKGDIRAELDKRFPGHIFDFSHTFGQMTMTMYAPDVVSALMQAIPHNIKKDSTDPAHLAWLNVERANKKPLLIAPYFLFLFNGELYVACYSASPHKSYKKAFKGTMINIALRNMLTASATPFQTGGEIHPPLLSYAGFKEEFHKKQIGVWGANEKPAKIVLRIDSNMAEFFANRYWHSTQEIEWNEDKTSCTLTITVPITNDLITWVWQWHPYVRVEEPQTLIDEILAKAEASIQHYKQA